MKTDSAGLFLLQMTETSSPVQTQLSGPGCSLPLSFFKISISFPASAHIFTYIILHRWAYLQSFLKFSDCKNLLKILKCGYILPSTLGDFFSALERLGNMHIWIMTFISLHFKYACNFQDIIFNYNRIPFTEFSVPWKSTYRRSKYFTWNITHV